MILVKNLSKKLAAFRPFENFEALALPDPRAISPGKIIKCDYLRHFEFDFWIEKSVIESGSG